jgi:hypothetical protein
MNRRNRPLPHPRPARLAIAAAVALCTLAGAAQAVQYQWRDDKGRMVYSDLPPPASVTPDRIVRAPGPRPSDATPAPAAATDPASDSAPQAVAAAPQSAAEREMAWRKRAEERAEAEKKAAEEAQRKLELAKACSDAQADLRLLESGQRIQRVNSAGEREFLSDDERRERLAATRKRVGERC